MLNRWSKERKEVHKMTEKHKSRNILVVARLIRVLEDTMISKEEKVSQIKMVRNNGDITDEEAMELARQVEEDVGNDSFQMRDMYLVRALYALEDERNADKALAAIADSLRVGIEVSGRTRLNAHYYRGCVFEDLKNDAATAESEYTLALSEQWDIDSVPCADRLARLKAIRGDIPGAIALWEKAAKLNPNNSTLLWNLSTAYREVGDLTRAEAIMSRILTIKEGH